jgi:hypothetical protein
MSNSNRSKNALTHGLYASDVLLPWENEQDFKELHDSLRKEYCPVGASEEAVVFDLASLHWRKRRLNIGSQLAFHRHPDAGALADAGRNGWSGIAEYLESAGDGDRMCDALRALAKSHAKTVQKVYALVGEQTQRMCPRDSVNQESSAAQESKSADPAEFHQLIAMMKELNVMNKELIVPALLLIENYDLDQTVSERAYRPDMMERHLKIEADIDKRIEKAIVRLVTIKEYKKFYVGKEIEASSTDVMTPLVKKTRESGNA